jgi:chemotaxis protein MotB
MTPQSADTQPAWLLTFADLMSLLFAFFVLLAAIAQQDVARFAELSASLGAALDAPAVHANAQPEAEPKERAIAPPLEDSPRVAVAREPLALALESALAQHAWAQEFAIDSDARGTFVRLPRTRLFEPGGAQLSADGAALLGELARFARESDAEIAVEAHAQDAASDPDNWELAAARAIAGVRQLAAAGELDSARLRATAYGPSRPLVPNSGPAARDANGRLEVVFLRAEVARTSLESGGSR